jgi:hypothetical protein
VQAGGRAIVGHVETTGGGGSKIGGTTPCNCRCARRRNAEPEPGAVNRAKRQRCRTADAGYTAERRPALRRVTRTPSSTGAIRPKRLHAGERLRGYCEPRMLSRRV